MIRDVSEIVWLVVERQRAPSGKSEWEASWGLADARPPATQTPSNLAAGAHQDHVEQARLRTVAPPLRFDT